MNKPEDSSQHPIRIVVIGAGTRGSHLARQLVYSAHLTQIVAVAEPDQERRENFIRELALQNCAAFAGWEELIESPLECDAAIIATLDNQHTGPAVACLRRGCHILLEKPMADNFKDCLLIQKTQEETEKIVSVCHTLRYRDPFRLIKQVVNSGRLGQLVHLEHMEAISNLRYSHNYVRGRWARQEETTFLLLHKCCHDLDLISWLINDNCRQVSSFGSLSFFRPDHAPMGSSKRCLDDCEIHGRCPYSALSLYVETDLAAWPARDVSPVHTREAHLQAVKTGPWGACVWHAGNNVVDHQVVLLEFSGGATATCTLTGYSSTNGRRTRLQGTRGELLYDEANSSITIKEFAKSAIEQMEVPPSNSYHPEDRDIVEEWLSAILDPSSATVSVDAQEAVRTHALVFAAEQSRKRNKVVQLPDYYDEANS